LVYVVQLLLPLTKGNCEIQKSAESVSADAWTRFVGHRLRNLALIAFAIVWRNTDFLWAAQTQTLIYVH